MDGSYVLSVDHITVYTKPALILAYEKIASGLEVRRWFSPGTLVSYYLQLTFH